MAGDAPTPRSLVALLHGVGARGDDLLPLGRLLSRALPNAAFAAPDAPERFDGDATLRQWFSLDAITPANRPARVAAARPGFDRLLGSVLADHGFAERPERVALVGFSQGAIMALDAAMSGRWPVAAVVALSGRLASPEPLAPPPGTGVLIVHGAADTTVPVAEGDSAAARLRARGVDARYHVLAKVGHEIAPEAVRLAAAFLRERLDTPAPLA